MKAWHFTGPQLRDGRPVPPDGFKLVHTGPVIPCEQGLHASLDPFDALWYAPGSTLCLVECGGTVVHQEDKLACSERTIIARMDAEPLLRHFARMQALSVVHLWDPPDVVLDYLVTGDKTIRAAAWGAAWDAARAAEWGAARGAARGAAWDAARGAAWDAARGAARAATWGAAWDAARGAAWDAASEEFNTLVTQAFEDYL
jgi:hypothetical protein